MKLFRSYSLIILLSFLLFGLVFIYLFHINLYKNYEETFSHHYDKIEQHMNLVDRFEWSESEISLSLEAALNHKDFSIIIYDSANHPLFIPDDERAMEHEIDSALIEKAASTKMISEGIRVDGNLSYLIASSLQNNIRGEESLIMAMVFHDLDHQYKEMIVMILITFTITIAFAGIILWFISRKITAPLREMNQIALKYAKGDFSPSVEVKTDDEIGQLGETFNYMADELNSLEEMRKDFIANVSHDLRSPLTSIKGFLVALLDGTIPEKRKEHYYLLMKDETERVIKLVNDTLDMTQLEAGQIKLNRDRYNLTRQLQRIVVKLEPQLDKKSMKIEIIPDIEELYVFADRDRMEQAILNLLQNAIQFSKQHSIVSIFLNENQDGVQVKIQDQGEGILEEDIQHIWERFYKTDRSRTNKVGTGIGLSIVKSIMDLHDVTIHVDSQIGKGTSFTFSLPISVENK